MRKLSYSAGLTATFLLLVSSPAVASERGGGAGGADDSGATRATSGREGTGPDAQRSDTATQTETARPTTEGTGVGPDSSDRQESRPEHRRSEGAGATTPGSAKDQPETTGGGQ